MKRTGEGQAGKAAKARKADPIAEALAKVSRRLRQRSPARRRRRSSPRVRGGEVKFGLTVSIGLTDEDHRPARAARNAEARRERLAEDAREEAGPWHFPHNSATTAEFRTNVTQTLKELRDSSPGAAPFRFLPSPFHYKALRSVERKYVHAKAEQLGLGHASSGEGEARFVQAYQLGPGEVHGCEVAREAAAAEKEAARSELSTSFGKKRTTEFWI